MKEITITLSVPEVGDALPFTVFKGANGAAIAYNSLGNLEVDGDYEVSADYLAKILGVPESLGVTSIIERVFE